MLLGACGNDVHEAPPQPAPRLPSVPQLGANAHRSGSVANTTTTTPAECHGSSIDPDAATLEETIGRLQGNRDMTAAYAELLGMSLRFPHSATLRVRAAGVAVQSTPPRSQDAARLYAEAIRLHDSGCSLSPRDLWIALQGMAVAHMQEGEFGAALPWLERGTREFASAPPTRYNHACALCRTQRVDECIVELTAVVDHVLANDAPQFVRDQDQRGASQYRELFLSDADLAPARHNPAFAALVERLNVPE